MTEEQLRTLAELVLVNDARLTKITAFLMTLTDDLLAVLPPDYDSIALIHHKEQLAALVQQSEASMDEARKYFGLPPEN
jgi:hypothetical protein